MRNSQLSILPRRQLALSLRAGPHESGGHGMISLKDFEPLKPAEEKILPAAAAGQICALGPSRPEAPTEACEVRAGFLRFLALGGDARAAVHESGLRVSGAHVADEINLAGAKDVRPLWLRDCRLAGGVSVSDASTKVICLDGSVTKYVRGDGVYVDGSLLLRQTTVETNLRFHGAEITGTMSCDGAHIQGSPWRSQRIAAELTTIAIGGNLEFRRGFKAGGVIQLDDAEIGGTFDCSEGFFHSGFDAGRAGRTDPWEKSVRALKCHRLDLSGSLYLRDAYAEGEVSFSGARIGGDIDCRNGKFRWAGTGDTTALRFARIEAGGNIYFSEGFEAMGRLQMNGARVRSNIDCRGGTFVAVSGAPGKDRAAPEDEFSEDAISLVNAEVNGALIVAPLERQNGEAAAIDGSLDLKSAHIRVLVDNPDSWPRADHSGGLRNVIHLDGFTYERFAGLAPVEAHIRMVWLKRQPASHVGRDFKPQPFEQLIKVLKNMGHPEEARRLSIERQGFLARRRVSGWAAGPGAALRAAGALLWTLTGGVLIGHGYRPMRVLLIMAIVGLACGYYYERAAEKGVFVPRDSQVFLHPDFAACRPENGGNWTRCADMVQKKFAEYPQFNPWVYSFNVLLPVVDLQQEKSWGPMKVPVRFEIGSRYMLNVPDWGTNALVLAELVFGWVASLLAIAAFSGLVKTE
jgi:hypothetical protein